MASKAFKDYVNALNQASLLAQKDFAAFWERLDTTKPEACREALIAYLPGVIYKYGQMAALAATQYYEAERLSAGGNEDFEAEMAEQVPYEQIEASIRYAAGHLFPEVGDGVQPEQDGSLFGREDR